MNLNERDVKLGFRNTGFGCVVRSCEISVWIVRPASHWHPYWEVHVFHGAPSGAFWRSNRALVKADNEQDARDIAEQIFGATHSGKFANVVDY